MRMDVQVEEPASPADEQPDGQPDDHEADARLRPLPHWLGQERLEEDDGQAEAEQAHRMTEAPGGAELRSGPLAPVMSGCDERRDGSQMVGVARMPQAEDDRHDDHEAERGAVREVRDPVVETEHRAMPPGAGRRSPAGRLGRRRAAGGAGPACRPARPRARGQPRADAGPPRRRLPAGRRPRRPLGTHLSSRALRRGPVTSALPPPPARAVRAFPRRRGCRAHP